MSGEFFFNGISSRHFGLEITGAGTYQRPARDVDVVEVPGRNGAIVYDNGRFYNIKITYEGTMSHDYPKALDALAAHLLLPGAAYARLEDTYDPEHYRLARYDGELKSKAYGPQEGRAYKGANISLTFDCKPQRFLKSGDTKTQYTTLTPYEPIYNPTAYSAHPLLRVYGTGTVTIGKQEITITEADEYTDIDTESMDCYKLRPRYNKNSFVTFSTDQIELTPGENALTLGSGITAVWITPRWWEV